MKRMIIISAAFILFASGPLFALEFIVGAKAGYYVWQPYLEDIQGFEDVDRGDGVLYGPIVSLLVTENLSFSVAALTGKQSKHWSEDYGVQSTGTVTYVSRGANYLDVSRTDIDTALSYRLTERLKIIAGYKYQYVKTTVKETARQDDIASTDYQFKYNVSVTETPAHGPAIGFGYSLPLSNIFFITANLTGLYMWSKLEFDEMNLETTYPGGTTIMNFSDISFDSEQIGFNLEPSLGVRVQENLIFTLGFRFQWIRIKFTEDVVLDGMDLLESEEWMDDYIYGAFVGIMLVF